ncbi:4-phosphopantoate--beta-alanine ligase [Novosphingobium bradum]|uniref:pantoate--beta-alanine ligase (AMP-forming) n=1 Tax=Novosphingobium bradum TaxID=1737444 RepID=A0ABV7ILZ4_9SPHN
MKILSKISEIRELLNPARASGKSIGVMGTSGRMHAGHQSLVQRAVDENELAIMFWLGAAGTALYDRNWDDDRKLVEATGIQYAYLPDYADYMPVRPNLTLTIIPQLSTGAPPMEKIEHLDAVTTSTAKLFNIFGPMRYYSGEKDWQQLAMFKRMVIDMAYDIEVIGCEVVREDDGLAMSSRNVKLTPEDRAKAPALYQALEAGKAAIEGGETSSAKVTDLVRRRMAEAGEVVYVHAVDAATLQPMDRLTGDIRIIASLQLGIVPLVDNIGAVAA